MTAEISASSYADFLAKEYLGSFVLDGGAAVKFAIVASGDDADALTTAVMSAARDKRYVATRVDAADTRVSLIQQIFFSIAADVDWPSSAREVVKAVAAKLFPVAIDGEPTLEAIGAATALAAPLIRHDMLKGLQQEVYQNYTLAKDFRLAMMQYCRAELEAGVGADQVRQVVGEWLRGELHLVSSLKEMAIFQKIGRHNARVMMASTARWLRQAGRAGLLVVIDVRRLAVTNRRDLPEGSLYYTASHVMDAYEVLRQFIDATDEMSGVLLLVVAPSELLNDERRGFPAYAALHNRIWDDVRDRLRPNPYSPMVRIAEGAVS